MQLLVKQGRIQRLKKGGHTCRVGIGAARRRTQLPVRALVSFPGLCAFGACSTSLKSLRARLRIYSMQSQACRGVWGHAPPGKF